MTTETELKLAQALWRLYRRPDRPVAWESGGNLPWNEPDFSQRMLREHLDQSHGAASRRAAERAEQIDWLWQKLGLEPGLRLLDLTCGPGLYAVELARRGLWVTGVDFSPASIAYARKLAEQEGVTERCTFIEQDVRLVDLGLGRFDAALFLYGQLGVFRREEAAALLAQTAQALKPGGQLAVELLDQERVDKKESTWWYTGDSGLWGDAPFLHLGERFWNAEQALSIERFTIVHLETGALDEVILCDQTYAIETMTTLMQQAGFAAVAAYPAWDGVPLYDAGEWVVYLAQT
jgi:SAM-dependent methyltransferase